MGMKRENYKRYGAGGPKMIVEPQWVKDLPENELDWNMEQEMAYYKWSDIYFRRGYSEDEWKEILEKMQSIKSQEFLQLGLLPDYDHTFILMVLRKKLEWQAEYFENFGHTESGSYKAARMRLCCRLIDIVCWEGMTGEYRLRLGEYVNMRNADGFQGVPEGNMGFLGGERQRVWFQKAYYLLFRVLYANILGWWD